MFFFPTFLSPISCCHHMCMHASSHVCVLPYYCKTRCWSTCKKARKKTASALKRTANRPATPPPSTRVLTCLFTPNGAYSLFYKLLPQIQFAEHYASIATLPNDASSPTHFLYSVLFRNFAERSWRLGGGPLWFLPEKAAPWRARDDPRGNRSNPGIFE